MAAHARGDLHVVVASYASSLDAAVAECLARGSNSHPLEAMPASGHHSNEGSAATAAARKPATANERANRIDRMPRFSAAPEHQVSSDRKVSSRPP